MSSSTGGITDLYVESEDGSEKFVVYAERNPKAEPKDTLEVGEETFLLIPFIESKDDVSITVHFSSGNSSAEYTTTIAYEDIKSLYANLDRS